MLPPFKVIVPWDPITHDNLLPNRLTSVKKISKPGKHAEPINHLPKNLLPHPDFSKVRNAEKNEISGEGGRKLAMGGIPISTPPPFQEIIPKKKKQKRDAVRRHDRHPTDVTFNREKAESVKPRDPNYFDRRRRCPKSETIQLIRPKKVSTRATRQIK